MLSDATITFNVKDQIGDQFDARRTKIWVSTNVPDETVIDTDSGTIRLGTGNVLIDELGNVSVTVWVPGADSNPDSWQTSIHVNYPDRNAPDGRKTRDFGPFTIIADAALADLVQQQEIPPTYLSEVTGALQGLVDATSDAQAAAEAAQASAEAAAASASQITGLTGEDDAVALLVATKTETRKQLDTTFAPVTRFPIFPDLRTRVELSMDCVDDEGRLWVTDGSWGPDYFDVYVNDDDEVRLPVTDARTGPTGRTGIKFSADPTDPDGWIYRGREHGTGAGPLELGDAQSFSVVVVCEWNSETATQLGSLIHNHPETGPDAARQWMFAVNQQSYDGPLRVVFHISSSGVGSLIESAPSNTTNLDFGASARSIKGRPCLVVVTFDHETGLLTTYIDALPDEWVNETAYPFPRGNPMTFKAGLNRDPARGKSAIGFALEGTGTYLAQNGWLDSSAWLIDIYFRCIALREIGLLGMRVSETMDLPFSLDDFMTDFQAGGGTNYSLNADMGAYYRGWDSFGGPFMRDLSKRITAPAPRISRPGGNGVVLSESAFMIQVSDGFPAITRRKFPAGILPNKALTRAALDDLSALAAGDRHFYFGVQRGDVVTRFVVEAPIETLTDHASGADWTVADAHEYVFKLLAGKTGWDSLKLREIQFDDAGTGTDHVLTFRNHMRNPRAGASATAWNPWTASGSAVAQARVVSAALGVSAAYMEYTFPTTTTPSNRNICGFRYLCADPFTPGQTYTFGPGAIELPRDNRIFASVQWMTAGSVNVGGKVNGTSVPLTAGGVHTLSENGAPLPYVISECPAGAGAGALAEVFVGASSAGVDWVAGDKIKVIGGTGVNQRVMPFSYFDGVVGGGAWTGSANNSASTRTDTIDGGESLVLLDLIEGRLDAGWLVEYGVYYEPGPVGATSRFKNFALWTH